MFLVSEFMVRQKLTEDVNSDYLVEAYVHCNFSPSKGFNVYMTLTLDLNLTLAIPLGKGREPRFVSLQTGGSEPTITHKIIYTNRTRLSGSPGL